MLSLARPLPFIALATLLAAAPLSYAVQPARWTQTTEADFEPGKTDKTVVTNLGDVKLAVSTQTIGEIPEQASLIFDMQPIGNDLYLAAGAEAKILRRRGDKVEEVVSLPGEQVFALDVDARGRLLLGISGNKSRIGVLDGDEVTTLIELDGVRYIWDMAADRQVVYLATGTEGKLLRVDLAKAHLKPATKPANPATAPATETAPAEGAATQAADDEVKVVHPAVTELLDASQANLLCLGRDKQGRLYAGSDTDGLVYRVTLKPDPRNDTVAETFVMYDAAEPEIGALLVLPDGTVFAGTADAEQARPGRLAEATSTPAGRPEVPAAPPAPPEPGDIPSVPPQPEPIGDPDKGGDGEAAPDEEAVEPEPMTPVEGEDVPAEASENEESIVAPRPSPLADGDIDPDAPAAPATEATPEQRDQLRQIIRQRLEQARKVGAMPMPQQRRPTTARRTPGSAAAARPTPGGAAAPAAQKDGNAVYRITPDGFVTELFRESVMVLRILEDPTGGGRILVATGNEAELFRIDPTAGETTILADLEPQQIPAVIRTDGGLLLGTANPATLVRLEPGFAKEGTYISDALDASQISLWGKMHVVTNVPPKTRVAIETRSGNVEDPDQAAWSNWSKAEAMEPRREADPLAPREVAVTSPPARFLQYRLTLTGDGQATPVVDRVDVTYVVPNIKPVIAAITATYPDQMTPAGSAPGGARPRPTPAAAAGAEEPEPQTTMNVEWEATDPNNDTLRYVLEYQPAGSKQWLPLAEDLDATTFEWQTRRVPDGRYILRVTASDAPDNVTDMARTASRRSDPILVDNTQPVLENLKWRVEKGVLIITGNAKDNLSALRSIHYAIDSTEEWKATLPDDLIFDSTGEAFTIKIPGLSAGPHVVTIRALDGRGNPRYEAVLVETKP